jgi:hypothetical protein
MVQPRFSIPSALASLYGILRPLSFPGVITEGERQNEEVSFSGIQVISDDEVTQTSHIGTPIMYPITFRAGSYRSFDTRGAVRSQDYGQLRLPISTVIEMSTTKVITNTQVSASRSSVKEVFTHGDWDIRLSGIVFDERNHPDGATTIETMEEKLLEFEALADSIGVDSDLLNRRGVERLVVKSLSFAQVPGRPRMFGYQMQCESDAPLELLIR